MMSGLQAIFQIQPDNAEALAELASLRLLDPETCSWHQVLQSYSSSKPTPGTSNSGMNSDSASVPELKTQPVPFLEAPWDERD